MHRDVRHALQTAGQDKYQERVARSTHRRVDQCHDQHHRMCFSVEAVLLLVDQNGTDDDRTDNNLLDEVRDAKHVAPVA